MRLFMVMIFALSGTYITTAQVYFSKVYNSTFVGPENIVSDHSEIDFYYWEHLKKKIGDLENYLQSPEKMNPNLALAKYPQLSKDNADADLKGLQSLLFSWESKGIKIVGSKEKNKSPIIYYETHEAKKPPFKRYVMRDGKVDTIIVDDRSVWRKHTPRPTNCLSADPNDCLLHYLRFYKFFDSEWKEIPTRYLADNYLKTTFNKETAALTLKKELKIN